MTPADCPSFGPYLISFVKARAEKSMEEVQVHSFQMECSVLYAHAYTYIIYCYIHTLVQMFRVYALYSWGMISKNSFRKGWGVMGRFWGKVPRKVEGFGGRFQITLWEGSEKLWKRSHRRIAHWQFFSNIINSSCCLAYDSMTWSYSDCA